MAPLLPKLRGQFAEFLNNASLVRLRILSSSTCVGLRYGYLNTMSISFSRQCDSWNFVTLNFHYAFRLRFFLFPDFLPLLRPLSFLSISVVQEFYTCYPSATPPWPHLRSRLTLGGRTFPRKPYTFDGQDSHFALATYSSILSSASSICPFDHTSSYYRMLLYRS